MTNAHRATAPPETERWVTDANAVTLRLRKQRDHLSTRLTQIPPLPQEAKQPPMIQQPTRRARVFCLLESVMPLSILHAETIILVLKFLTALSA